MSYLEGTKRLVCPKCGSTITVSVLCQYSVNHTITRSGRLSKNYKKVDLGSMDESVAYCTNESCNVSWDSDQFIINSEDEFIDFKYL